MEYPVGHRPTSLAVGDLNGDRKVDAVTANNEAGSISVLVGNGNGTFEPRRVISEHPAPGTVLPAGGAVALVLGR